MAIAGTSGRAIGGGRWAGSRSMGSGVLRKQRLSTLRVAPRPLPATMRRATRAAFLCLGESGRWGRPARAWRHRALPGACRAGAPPAAPQSRLAH